MLLNRARFLNTGGKRGLKIESIVHTKDSCKMKCFQRMAIIRTIAYRILNSKSIFGCSQDDQRNIQELQDIKDGAVYKNVLNKTVGS